MLQSVKISIEIKKLNKKEEFWNSIFHDQKLRGKYHNNELEIYSWDFFQADFTLNNILQSSLTGYSIELWNIFGVRVHKTL